MTTRANAIDSAAEVFARARAERDQLSPRAAAEAAWYVGHRLKTVDAIEALITQLRTGAASDTAPEQPAVIPLAA